MADTPPDTDASDDAPPQNPWRKPVVWGRMPTQTFRAVSLTPTETAARPARPSPTFLQDSLMIPARPDPAQGVIDTTPKDASIFAPPLLKPEARSAEPTLAASSPPRAQTRSAEKPAPNLDTPVDIPVFASPSPRGGASRRWLYGGVAAGVLALVAVIAFALMRNGGDPVGSGDIPPTPSDVAAPSAPAVEAAPPEAVVVTEPEPAETADTPSPSALRPAAAAQAPVPVRTAPPDPASAQERPPVVQAEPEPTITLPVVTPVPVQAEPAPPQPSTDDAAVITRPRTLPEG